MIHSSISHQLCVLAAFAVSELFAALDGALWEIWAAGASHAGGSSSPRHSAAAVPLGLLGSPYSQYGILWQARGGPQDLETMRAGGNQALRVVPAAVGRPVGAR